MIWPMPNNSYPPKLFLQQNPLVKSNYGVNERQSNKLSFSKRLFPNVSNLVFAVELESTSFKPNNLINR